MLPQKKIHAYVESLRIPPYKQSLSSEPLPPGAAMHSFNLYCLCSSLSSCYTEQLLAKRERSIKQAGRCFNQEKSSQD